MSMGRNHFLLLLLCSSSLKNLFICSSFSFPTYFTVGLDWLLRLYRTSPFARPIPLSTPFIYFSSAERRRKKSFCVRRLLMLDWSVRLKGQQRKAEKNLKDKTVKTDIRSAHENKKDFVPYRSRAKMEQLVAYWSLHGRRHLSKSGKIESEGVTHNLNII